MRQLIEEIDGETYITRLTRPIRVLMYILIIIPKLFICVYLLLQGLLWLTATTRFEDLVMNAVAMDFVLKLDEVLYQTFLPPERKIEVQRIDFYKEPDGDWEEQEKHMDRQKVLRGYALTATYLAMSLFSVVLYAKLLQPVLPTDLRDMREACLDMMDD